MSKPITITPAGAKRQITLERTFEASIEDVWEL